MAFLSPLWLSQPKPLSLHSFYSSWIFISCNIRQGFLAFVTEKGCNKAEKSLRRLFRPLVPVFAGDARRFGCERRPIIFLVMIGCPEHIFAAEVQKRNIGKHYQDIAQIGDCPHIAEIKPCDGTEDAKEGDKNAEDTDGVGKGLFGGNPAGGNFGEAEKADYAGESKEAEADGDQEDHDIVK